MAKSLTSDAQAPRASSASAGATFRSSRASRILPPRTYANSPAASAFEAKEGLMATRKRWSRTVGARRGNRVRIYERGPGGMLYMAVWDAERGKYRLASLGHRDRERATRDAADLLRLRDA